MSLVSGHGSLYPGDVGKVAVVAAQLQPPEQVLSGEGSLLGPRLSQVLQFRASEKFGVERRFREVATVRHRFVADVSRGASSRPLADGFVSLLGPVRHLVVALAAHVGLELRADAAAVREGGVKIEELQSPVFKNDGQVRVALVDGEQTSGVKVAVDAANRRARRFHNLPQGAIDGAEFVRLAPKVVPSLEQGVASGRGTKSLLVHCKVVRDESNAEAAGKQGAGRGKAVGRVDVVFLERGHSFSLAARTGAKDGLRHMHWSKGALGSAVEQQPGRKVKTSLQRFPQQFCVVGFQLFPALLERRALCQKLGFGRLAREKSRARVAGRVQLVVKFLQQVAAQTEPAVDNQAGQFFALLCPVVVFLGRPSQRQLPIGVFFQVQILLQVDDPKVWASEGHQVVLAREAQLNLLFEVLSVAKIHFSDKSFEVVQVRVVLAKQDVRLLSNALLQFELALFVEAARVHRKLFQL